MRNTFSDKPPVQHRCEDCGAKSPLAETNYSLISQKHAWRMLVHRTQAGRKEPVWFCPRCWERNKPRPASAEWSLTGLSDVGRNN